MWKNYFRIFNEGNFTLFPGVDASEEEIDKCGLYYFWGIKSNIPSYSANELGNKVKIFKENIFIILIISIFYF